MNIAIVANYGLGLVKFRQELIEKLIELNHNVYIFYPSDEYEQHLSSMGATIIDIPLSRHGINPLREIKLIKLIRKELKAKEIDIALTFTIKPNIYVGLFKPKNVKFIPNITGLGKMLETESKSKTLFLKMYKLSLKNASHVFFQNVDNYREFSSRGIVKSENFTILPGSGVNLEYFDFVEYDFLSKVTTEFIYIGRLSKDKGINELLDAYEAIDDSDIKLRIVGIPEDKEIYSRILKSEIEYHEKIEDVRELIAQSHCTILPSYHEGMSNVLLESAAIGRPLIASNISGCKEIISDNGLLTEIKSVKSLKEAMLSFKDMSFKERKKMGLNSRIHVEKNFNRNIIIDEYLNKIGEKEK